MLTAPSVDDYSRMPKVGFHAFLPLPHFRKLQAAILDSVLLLLVQYCDQVPCLQRLVRPASALGSPTVTCLLSCAASPLPQRVFILVPARVVPEFASPMSLLAPGTVVTSKVNSIAPPKAQPSLATPPSRCPRRRHSPPPPILNHVRRGFRLPAICRTIEPPA